MPPRFVDFTHTSIPTPMKQTPISTISALIVASGLALVLASCSGRNARSLYDEARAAEDSGKFAAAAEKYDEVAREFPTEAVAETSLYKVVTIRSNAPGDKGPAVEAQRRFLGAYPQSGWAPKVTFMLAFNFNNEMAQYDSAKKYYAELVKEGIVGRGVK